MSTDKRKRATRALGQDDDVLEEPTKHRAVAVSRSVRLSRSFFGVSCERLARALLGKVLARRLPDDTLLRCRIVETECYPGGDDRASSSFQGRRTESNEPLYMEPGTAYVYLTYGMYHCFNISSEGDGAAVLLRAAVPIEGLELMRTLRGARRKDCGRGLKERELCNGPAKLCLAMAIDKAALNKEFLPDSQTLWLERDGGDVQARDVVVATRIGIDGAGKESADKPLRFYVRGCACVSVRDKKAEALTLPS
uniref:DNA-3-methyladenine glycosylase n=1 Tax=Ixodes ricinus TaxID=34613 RepID=A0A6B0V795_IXORI